jgi:hypothetical protein
LRSNKNNNLFFKYDSSPFGISFPDWTSVWWKWLHSIPKYRNPASDTTGENCNVLQEQPHVWFLAGTFGGSVVRNCKIEYGKALLFPIITSIFSFALDPNLKSEEELVSHVIKDIDSVSYIKLQIDDMRFEVFDQFRVRSEPFYDNIEGRATISVSDGYWIFLQPPNIGGHHIFFSAKNIDFFNEVSYNISIY